MADRATDAHETKEFMRMQRQVYNIKAAKRPVNLSMNGDLLERARSEGLNLSALAKVSRRHRTRRSRTGAMGRRHC